MPRQTLASASDFDPVLGRGVSKRRGKGVVRNPVQRYKIFLEYANFETQKVKFFDKNLHISEKSSTFAAQNRK